MKTPLQRIYDELVRHDKVESQFDFGKKLGYKSEGYISTLLKSKDDLPFKLQKKLHEIFGIKQLWLATNGEQGEMFNSDLIDRQNESIRSRKSPEKPSRRVPMIGEAAAGGDMEINVHEGHTPTDYIDVGDLLSDSEAAFTVYGNSMTPAYPSGCVLGIKRNLDGFIQPGETYLLLTKSNRIFKRLYYNDDKTGYLCYSDNIQKYSDGPFEGRFFYPPFEVKGDDVISVFDITGMIKRNRNSGIINRQK